MAFFKVKDCLNENYTSFETCIYYTTNCLYEIGGPIKPSYSKTAFKSEAFSLKKILATVKTPWEKIFFVLIFLSIKITNRIIILHISKTSIYLSLVQFQKYFLNN